MYDDEDINEYLRQYLMQGAYGGQGLLGGGEAAAMPPPRSTSGLTRIAEHPLVQFGLGVFSNNNQRGQLGPALGGGLEAMQRGQALAQKQEMERARMLAAYQKQTASHGAIDKLGLPPEQAAMLKADPSLARSFMTKQFGWDADSPTAHAQKLSRAAAGAGRGSSTTIMLPGEAKELGKEIPGRFLDEFKTGRDKVAGALNNWGTWERVEGAARNGAIVGPMADKRMTAAQLGDWLGMTGKDNQEKLANTRALIQGFADLALGAREYLKGQGQITVDEQRLAALAKSGQWDELSPTEVITLARIGRRSALEMAAEHNRRIEEFASRDPTYAQIARHYQQPIPRHMWPTPTAAAKSSLKAAKHIPGYVEAFRKQFGPEWTDEVMGER